METDYKVSFVANYFHITQRTKEEDYKVSLIANNLYLTQ